MKARRIVLTTLGSLGDLHPYVAIGLGLQQRGHVSVIATSEIYREKVEREGLTFVPVRPNLPDLGDEKILMKKIMDPTRGSKFVIRDIAMRWLSETYSDLCVASKGADLMIGHPLTYALPILAETRGIPWIGTALQPMVFMSSHDLSAFGPFRFLLRYGWSQRIYRTLFRWMKDYVRKWALPIDALRAKEGLGPCLKHPLLESIYSDLGNLALFSEQLAVPQPDWPCNTIQTGFPFYDKGMEEKHGALSHGLEQFLSQGEPPVVFTLGSSAVMTAGNFYRESCHAALKAGVRAVLLVGRDERNQMSLPKDPNLFIDEYAPYSMLFSRSAAIFHQGGVGTTAQAMRAGKPMVIVPFSHDQPDHAYRIERLGMGFGLSRRAYRADRVVKLIERLKQPSLLASAEIVGQRIRKEDGVGKACDAIEKWIEQCHGCGR